MKTLLITIDGPAGAGKTTRRPGRWPTDWATATSTPAPSIAGWPMALKHAGSSPGDDAALARMLEGLRLGFQRTEKGLRLTADGEDITDCIRTPEMSMLASAVSARPAVRAFLLQVQREGARPRKGGRFSRAATWAPRSSPTRTSSSS